MPDKASRTNSVTPASERDSKKKEDDVESVDMVEELDDEDFDDDSCDETREMRVRFKVRDIFRVNQFSYFNSQIFAAWINFYPLRMIFFLYLDS